jgi:hypothetical protein
MPKPCACGAELIGLSDGSSVHGWRCSDCGHEWPRQITVRGLARFQYVKSGAGLMQQQHVSDPATHNAPALPAGPCDCWATAAAAVDFPHPFGPDANYQKPAEY